MAAPTDIPTASSLWHSRGYMPHFGAAHVVQHVTYRLADSLPASVLTQLRSEARSVPRARMEAEQRLRIEAYIDAGLGSCLLSERAAASMIQESLLHFDGVRYRLFAWVVMPNHVHVLFQPSAGWTMARIVASWKSFTGRRLSQQDRSCVDPTHRVWAREYWDRFIRDEEHFVGVKQYIHQNPVKARLVRSELEWEWSSARLEPGGPRERSGQELEPQI